MAKSPRPLERTIQSNGMTALRCLGLALYRRNVSLAVADYQGRKRVIRSGEPGQSDCYGWIIATGRHVEIEWKRPGNRPTSDQLTWLKWCTKQGVIAYWADSVDTAVRVMRVMIQGGRISWHDDDNYDVIKD